MSNPRNPAPVSKMTGSGFYLNSGRNVVMDEGFLTHVATLLEHNSFEEDSSDAFTATEYANEIYRVLFAQRGSPSPQTRAAPTPTEAPPVESQAVEIDKDFHRAASALLNTLWQKVYSGSRTHEENWSEMDRQYPQARWLHDELKAAKARAALAAEGSAE